jgi:hypothetical protein
VVVVPKTCAKRRRSRGALVVWQDFQKVARLEVAREIGGRPAQPIGQKRFGNLPNTLNAVCKVVFFDELRMLWQKRV